MFFLHIIQISSHTHLASSLMSPEKKMVTAWN
jgi:hypothetical protein